MNIDIENKQVIPMEEKDQIEKSETVVTGQNILETITNTLNDIDPSLGDYEAFAAILSVPEPILKTIKPEILAEIERQLSDSNTALEIASALNINSIKEEEFGEAFNNVCKLLEEDLEGQLEDYQIDFLKEFFGLIFKCVQDSKAVSKRIIPIPIQLCNSNAKIPSYANIGDAGLDIYALEDYEIKPGETKLIPTGLKVAIPTGYELQIRPKSGRSLKTKLRIANTPATIDSGYRDEIGVIVENIEAPIKDITYDFDEEGRPIITSILHGSSFFIEKGTKFAQLVLNEIPTAQFFQVKDISKFEGDRGGGFGSSSIYSQGDSRYGTDLL